MLYLRATFSAVTPIWIFSNGSLSAVSIASTATRLPIFVPQRAPVITWGARLMLSAPPDTAMSHSPSAIICAAEIVDCTDDPHRSEEHTSELQSLMRISYAVFCLKKK